MNQNEWDLLSDPVSLRPMTEDDLEAVLKIESKSYPAPWTRENFVQEINKPFARTLVITDDETDSKVIGYITYWMLFEECHILNLTVALEYRGLGFAQKLVRQALNESIKKDFKRLFLEVRRSNEAAVKLYQKMGFFIDHIKKDFYQDGEEAYFMVLYLDKSNQI